MPATAIPTVAEDFLQRNGGIVYRNLVQNPSAEVVANGFVYGTPSGTILPARVADTTMGSSFAYQLGATGMSGVGIQAVNCYAAPSGNVIAPFVTGKRYAFRMRVRVVSVTGGTITSMSYSARATNSVGGAGADYTPNGGTSAVSNPTVGNYYDLTGWLDSTAILAAAPTLTQWGYNFNVIVSAGTTAVEVHFENLLICEITAGTTNIPSYFDGRTQYANWEGVEDASTSVIYAGDGFPLIPGYTFDTGAGVAWVDSKAQLLTLGNNNTFAAVPNISSIADCQITVSGSVGDWTSPQYLNACPMRIDGSNFLQCRLGWYSNGQVVVQIMKTVANVEGTLASAGSIATGAVGSRYWLVGSIVGNLLTAQYYTTDPVLPGSTPASQITYTLTGSDATLFGNSVKGKPMLRGAFSARNWKIDRFDVYEFTRARYWTGVTKDNYSKASRFILPDAPTRALAIFNPSGAGETFADVWRSFGWLVTEDKTGDQNTASIVSKVLSGGYKNVIFDFGYAAVFPVHLDAAYQLYNTYGVSVFTCGNDTNASVGNPIWTGTTGVAGGGPNQLYPAVSSLVDHPITKEWGNTPHYDGDARAYLTGIRSSAVVVGDFLDQQAGGARRPAIVAEEHATNGARYIHSEPYNWGGTIPLRRAIINWLTRSPRPGVDLIYGDSDNFLTEDEVIAARAAGLVISDSPALSSPLNFRRFQRTAQAGILDSFNG